MNNQVIHTQFEQQAILTPANTAVQDSNRSVTYAELNKEAGEFAALLLGLGLKKGHVVGVLMQSCIELIAALLGNFKAGTVYLPVNTGFGRRRMSEVFLQCNCNVVVIRHSFLEEMINIINDLKIGIDTIITADGTNYKVLVQQEGRFAEKDIERVPCLNVPEPDDSNYIFCTSGTTGTGKAILGSHKGLANFINWEKGEFGIDQHFRISQLTAVTFDASLRDIFVALTTGSTLVIPSEEIRINTAALVEWLSKNQVNLVHCVPSMFKLLTKELASRGDEGKTLLSHLKIIIMAGEPLYSKDVHNWIEATGGTTELVTLYGTTETTMCKTFHRIKEVPENTSQVLHVGKPITDAHIIIVNGNQLCRIGEIGEVFVKSPFMTKGYYNNQALTDTVFVQNPLNTERDIVYRTGDMGKYQRDRNIEIIGRIDDQVKVNGVRIEIREIELAVLSFKGISETVVVPVKDKDNQVDLVCYYVGCGVKEEDVLVYLEKELPANHVPSFFVQLPSFPLTINGKIDKKSLPKPEMLREEKFEYEAAVSETEKRLEVMWEEVLGITKIGRKASFFDLGGNSLKSLLLVSKIYKAFDVLIKLEVIFTYRTIEGIARFIESSKKQEFAGIPPLEKKEFYEVSNSQKRAWLQHQTQSQKSLYNVAGAYSFEGILNTENFCKAFDALVQRHEVLRTVFLLVDGEVVQQVNQFEAGKYAVTLANLKDAENRDGKATAMISAFSNTVFDLETGPLFKAVLLQLSDTETIFSFTVHHIISDAWSMEVLTREMFLLYNGFCKNETVSLEPLKIQYKDYAAWQNKQLDLNGISEHKQFWINQFRDFSPPLNFSTNIERPALKTYDANILTYSIDNSVKIALEELSHKADATLFMTFVALINIVISRHTGETDITIGSPVAGREHPDLENQVGSYINTIPIRTKINKALSFSSFLSQVKQHVIEILKYQIYPFDQLIEDLNVPFAQNRNPMFDAGFTYIKENELTPENDTASLDGLKVNYIGSGFSLVKADIWFKVIDNADSYILDIPYNKQLFSQAYVRRIMKDIENLLNAVIADPSKTIDELLTAVAGQELKLEQDVIRDTRSKNSQSLKSFVRDVAVK